MGARVLHRFHQLGDDVRRRRAVRVAHAEVDDVLPRAPRARLGRVHLGEHVGGQAADAVEFVGHRSSSRQRLTILSDAQRRRRPAACASTRTEAAGTPSVASAAAIAWARLSARVSAPDCACGSAEAASPNPVTKTVALFRLPASAFSAAAESAGSTADPGSKATGTGWPTSLGGCRHGSGLRRRGRRRAGPRDRRGGRAGKGGRHGRRGGQGRRRRGVLRARGAGNVRARRRRERCAAHRPDRRLVGRGGTLGGRRRGRGGRRVQRGAGRIGRGGRRGRRRGATAEQSRARPWARMDRAAAPRRRRTVRWHGPPPARRRSAGAASCPARRAWRGRWRGLGRPGRRPAAAGAARRWRRPAARATTPPD